MLKIKTLRIIICLLCPTFAYSSISIVYNLKIAETTKRQTFEKNGEHPSTIALTPFNQFRRKYSGSRHNYGGSLLSYIYSPEDYYARVDFACANVNADHGTFEKTQTDDLLFSAGYSFALNERSKLTLSGLFGIPTHKDVSIVDPQFGYAHIGLGGQLDGSFIFSKYHENHFLRMAFRAIHFFKRKTYVDSNIYNFSLGTLIDLYLALHLHTECNHFDIGCNPTLLCAPSIMPTLNDALRKTEYKRISFFSVYKFKFTLEKHPTALALAISYGFDFEPKRFGNKRIVTIWGSWTVGF